MKFNTKLYWFTLLLLMMFAVPAFAQFEVSPDHVDSNPSSSRQDAHANPMMGLKLQIAEHKKGAGHLPKTGLYRSPLWWQRRGKLSKIRAVPRHGTTSSNRRRNYGS